MNVGNRTWEWEKKSGFACNPSSCIRCCENCNVITRCADVFCGICRPCCDEPHPRNQEVTASDTAIFSVKVNQGNPSFLWQWLVDDTWTNLTTNTRIAHIDRPKLVITNVPFSWNGRQYRVAITRTAGNITSNPATLTVNYDSLHSAATLLGESTATPALPAWRLCSCGTLHINQTFGSNRIENTGNQSPWSKYSTSITRINFIGVVRAGVSIANLFSGFDKLTSITNINNLNVTDTEDFSGLFAGCSSLRTLNLGGTNGTNGWDMSKANQMSGMFEGMVSLDSLRLPRTPPDNNHRFAFTCDVLLPDIPESARLSGRWVNTTDTTQRPTSAELTAIHDIPPPPVASSHLRFLLSDANERQSIELLRPAESEIRTEISDILDALIPQLLPLPSGSTAANLVIQEFAQRLNNNREIRGAGHWTAVLVTGNSFNRREMKVQNSRLGLDVSVSRQFTLTATLPD